MASENNELIVVESHKKTDDRLPIEIIEEKTLFHGKWLGARQIIYRHKPQNGVVEQESSLTSAENSNIADISKLPMWQVAYRASKPKTALVDGVSVLATLTKSRFLDGTRISEKFLVLVKQFRLPIMKYSLEFPAGLLDDGETAIEAGMRELKEETGYTAKMMTGSTTGVQTLDPGLTDDSINFVMADIDGDDPMNGDDARQQKLDDDERIDVILVPLKGILDEFKRFTEEGVCVEAMVYSFGIGLAFNSLNDGTVRL